MTVPKTEPKADTARLVSTSVALSSVTVNSPSPGVFDAADTTFTAVSGAAVCAIILYKDTGTAGTSPLLAYIDGISVTQNGGDIVVQYDSGQSHLRLVKIAGGLVATNDRR